MPEKTNDKETQLRINALLNIKNWTDPELVEALQNLCYELPYYPDNLNSLNRSSVQRWRTGESSKIREDHWSVLVHMLEKIRYEFGMIIYTPESEQEAQELERYRKQCLDEWHTGTRRKIEGKRKEWDLIDTKEKLLSHMITIDLRKLKSNKSEWDKYIRSFDPDIYQKYNELTEDQQSELDKYLINPQDYKITPRY